MRVAQIGHTMNDTWLSSEQRRGQDGQRRIFRAADLDRTGKRTTAVNEDLIHTWQKGTVSRRYNRSSNKCRGNFFPPEPKETHLSGRALFLRPASHRGQAAMAPPRSGRALTRRPPYLQKAQPPDRAILRAKVCAAPASRCKEDSRQLDRKLPRHFPADGFSETGPGCSSLAWPHSLALARVHHPKDQWQESSPPEISLPS